MYVKYAVQVLNTKKFLIFYLKHKLIHLVVFLVNREAALHTFRGDHSTSLPEIFNFSPLSCMIVS